MKVNIRRGVFETNSSSSHALVLSSATHDDSMREIASAIRNGLLNVGYSSITCGETFQTFMDKLAYLTALRICAYCEFDDRYTVAGVRSCREVSAWENEVVARLAERGIHCDRFRYDSIVDDLNETWGGLDHQVVEDGCDSVGSCFIVNEQRWVRKGKYGWREMCNADDAGATKEWLDICKCLNPAKMDIDVLFDEDIAIRYGWDSDDYYPDNDGEIPYCPEDVIAEAKENRKSRDD